MDVLMVFKLAPFECSPSEDENPQLVRDCRASHWSARFNDDASQKSQLHSPLNGLPSGCPGIMVLIFDRVPRSLGTTVPHCRLSTIRRFPD